MTDKDAEYIISRLEEALREQQKHETKTNRVKQVVYCFDCDKIELGTFCPEGCIEHDTASSDGYEHGGIQAAITALRQVTQ